ncbi:hypothetical protein NFI96_018657, partial [Prochilodus magdalenae]
MPEEDQKRQYGALSLEVHPQDLSNTSTSTEDMSQTGQTCVASA